MDTKVNKRLQQRISVTNQAKRSQRKAIALYKKIQNLYDDYKIPCDWQIAQNHGLASQIGKESDQIQIDHACACCGSEIKKQPLGIFCDLKELNIKGVGYPQYFSLIKYSILLLLGFTVFVGLPSILLILNSDFCYQINNCGDDIFTKFSSANFQNNVQLNKFWYMHLLFLIYYAIILQLLRKQIRQFEFEVDESLEQPESFAIWVKNIPLGLNKDYESELLFYFQKYSIPGRQLYIKKVLLAYDLTSFKNLQDEYVKQIQLKQAFMRKNLGVQTLDFDSKIDELKEKLNNADYELVDLKKDFQGHMFLQFAKESDKKLTVQNHTLTFKDRLLLYFQGSSKKNKKKFNTLFWQDRHLLIEQAPDPMDIDWFSLNNTVGDKINSRVLYYFLEIIFLIIIQQIINYVVQRGDKEITYLFITIVILIDYFIVPQAMLYVANQSKYYLHSKRQAFQTYSTLIVQTLIGFMILYACLKNNINLYQEQGLVSFYSIYMIMNITLQLAIQITDPLYLLKVIKRIIYYGNNDCMFTQREANELMQGNLFQVEKRYPYIIKTMWMVSFFVSSLPCVSFLYLVGLFFYYWFEKINFLKKRSVDDLIYNNMAYDMVELLDISIVFYSLGNFISRYYLLKTYGWVDIFIVVLALAHAISPTGKLNEFVFPYDKKKEFVTYEQADKAFDTDYDRENPLTSNDALQRWIKLKSFAQGDQKGLNSFKKLASILESDLNAFEQQRSGYSQQQYMGQQNSNFSELSEVLNSDYNNSNMIVLEIPNN